MKYVFALSIFASVLNIVFSFSLYPLGLCVLNSGVAFGINIYGEALLSAVLIVLIIILGIKQTGRIRYLLFSLAVLGLSNLIVRVWYGVVCDYISLFGISFNLADAFIVIVSAYLFFYLVLFKDKIV